MPFVPKKKNRILDFSVLDYTLELYSFHLIERKLNFLKLNQFRFNYVSKYLSVFSKLILMIYLRFNHSYSII